MKPAGTLARESESFRTVGLRQDGNVPERELQDVRNEQQSAQHHMEYSEIKPCHTLAPFIHSYWELKGGESDNQWERIFPDGCAGLVLNLGSTCVTDNGSVSMAYGKTYAVGAMTSFKDSFIDSETHLLGVCLKPAAFTNFYRFIPQNELINSTVEFDAPNAFSMDRIPDNPFDYLNHFFSDRKKRQYNLLQPVLDAIDAAKGQINVHELSKRHFTTVRQLERSFKTLIGISPKEYTTIVRFQNALRTIKNANGQRSLSDIAFECGYYDHSHLTHAIKRNTGLSPSQL